MQSDTAGLMPRRRRATRALANHEGPSSPADARFKVRADLRACDLASPPVTLAGVTALTRLYP